MEERIELREALTVSPWNPVHLREPGEPPPFPPFRAERHLIHA